MNKTVTLVNEWGKFEARHPHASLEDFCRHYLAHQDQQKLKGRLVGGVVPYLTDGLLLKIIGRIHKLNLYYANAALKETEVNHLEEFGMLTYIKQEKNPRKTEVIYANLFELSSGTDMLNRMKKKGLIEEHDDREDKRSKRLTLTAKGERLMDQCKQQIIKNATMVLHDMNEDDKALCIQLLQDVEVKFSALWQKYRGASFETVYKEVMG
ncbi:MAG TPA: winged helix-turn-helix domain-containing protein [Chitinophaga sp.]